MTFFITYNYGELKGKEMRVHNCKHRDDAKYRLHGYLIRKHGNKELDVISCVEEKGGVDDIFGLFGDVFK